MSDRSDIIHDKPAVMEYLNNLEDQIHHLRRLLDAPANQTKTQDPPYISQREDILQGEPIITGSRTPVRAIVEYWKFGDAPEDIVRKLPHLRLAHVFAALSYYDDHRDEIEHYIRLNQVPKDD
jgi:uncharacterized protein (DUF433 family)